MSHQLRVNHLLGTLAALILSSPLVLGYHQSGSDAMHWCRADAPDGAICRQVGGRYPGYGYLSGHRLHVHRYVAPPGWSGKAGPPSAARSARDGGPALPITLPSGAPIGIKRGGRLP